MYILSDKQAKSQTKNLDMAKKKKSFRERLNPFLIAAQNNAIRTMSK